jgi:hypothetical protein
MTASKPLLLGALCLFFMTTSSLPAVADERPSPPWERLGSNDGIEVFRRSVPGSPVIALRGEGIVNASLEVTASVLLDETRATEWIDRLEEIKVLKMISNREFLEYNHVRTPMVLKDRDFVNLGKIDFDPQKRTMQITLTATGDPLAPKTKYVRGELNGYWKLQDVGANKTLVIAEMHADPKGGVPKWIVNLVQKSWPHKSIESLRKQVAKSDIKVLKAVTSALHPEAVQ